VRTFRVIGLGRAGGALAGALEATGRWRLASALGRGDDVRHAATDVDLLVISTPDAAIAGVARAVEPGEATVVAHLAGSLGLDVLEPHARRAAMHPLMTLPDATSGARLLRGAWFAVAGDPLADTVVHALDGRPFAVTDQHRAVYHAAACVAANHIVALLGQVERLAATADVPFAAFFDIVRAAVDNVERLGPTAALTGPAARGDFDTIARHLAAMPAEERPAYEALAAEARRLVA
jgi:predicted short-subunit dehydrogenase-like oxidoreductase (DUF2520 family)